MSRAVLLAAAFMSLAGCGAPANSAAAVATCGGKTTILTGRVVDGANILANDDERALTAQLSSLEAGTKHQMVIVTLPSLNGMRIEDYGLCLGKGWGVGRKGVDDGLLFIVAPNERKVRIEVGKGLENLLTNDEAATILNANVMPAFRSGDMKGGIGKGTSAIIGELS